MVRVSACISESDEKLDAIGPVQSTVVPDNCPLKRTITVVFSQEYDLSGEVLIYVRKLEYRKVQCGNSLEFHQTNHILNLDHLGLTLIDRIWGSSFSVPG